MTNILLSLLKLLAQYWKRDAFMHDLSKQRAKYQERIKRLRNG